VRRPQRVILVTGGRLYGEMYMPDGMVRPDHHLEKWHVGHVLDVIHKTYRVEGAGITRLFQGGAGGADRHAREWAHQNGVVVVTYHYVEALGPRGGPARNEAMATDVEMLQRALGPDAIVGVVFPGNRGTDGTRRLMEQYAIEIRDESKGWATYRGSSVQGSFRLVNTEVED
jgi:hypothetical protein